ncbi:Slit 3 protein [Echinococcus granulosus]|uniref:Slit 3 protein n=1 Tax=Echinococcus granulosus TaxID=6210 RepID=W6URB8_ECHGR|nr:Slit 3 protein [Echinococcus granulosus]EUB64275.1 Slit 3 protein [Echinococcus granulosus]
MKMQIVIALLLLLLLSLTARVKCLNCPNLCQCASSMMDCQRPGLEAFPPAPSGRLEMVVVANQTFRRVTLDREALRPYRSPEHGGQVRLRLLKIRNCNIVSIASNAFANLGSHLEELDLSGNPLHTIEAHAFTGLRLKSLFLNNLQNPVIHDQAFSSIIEVQGLSLQNSHLTSLPLRPLIELASLHGLKSLSIRGNDISHLPPNFEPAFRLLQSFELSENPWHCDCNLRWLIQLQKWSRLTKTSGAFVGSSRDSRSDIRQPTCISPVEFADYTFDEITLSESETFLETHLHTTVPKRPELACVTPRVEHIEVDLRHSNSEQELDNMARIVCHMKGAPDIFVSWFYHNHNGDIRNVTEMSKRQEDGQILPHPYAPPQPKQITSRLSVKQVSETDMYSCMGQNILGNTSVTVSIHWSPKKPGGGMQLVPNEEVSGERSVSRDLSNSLIGSIRPAEYSILAKRFSLMDVIGAVLGTFLVTILMFIIAYRTSKLYVYRRSKLCAQSDPILRHHENAKRTPDGTSSSAASSSLLKFSQLQFAPASRYPPDYTQTSHYNQGGGGGLGMPPKQRDSGTFTSHSTSSSQNANGQGGAYETVYNETSTNQVMYETPGDNLATAAAAAAAACHPNQQPFLFPFAQSTALGGYPLMFGSTLPSQSTATAYALGVSSPSAPTYIPPPPTGQQPSLPRSVQSQTGPLHHVYSSTVHMGDQYSGPGISTSVQTSAPVSTAPQHNHVT